MKKQVFHDATTGILIGLTLSIIFFILFTEATTHLLSPNLLLVNSGTVIRFTVL